MQLTGHAGRNRLPVAVEDVGGAVADGPADGNRPQPFPEVRRDGVAAAERGRLGGAVAIADPGAREERQGLADMAEGEGLAADQQLLDSEQAGRRVMND